MIVFCHRPLFDEQGLRITFGHLPLTVPASVPSDAHGDEGLESVPELDITDIPLVEPFAVLVRNVSSSAEPATLAQAFRGLEVGHDCCPEGGGGAVNTRTGKGLRITRPGKGRQILPLPAISASMRARITKLGKRKDMPVNFMVCNFGDLGSIF